MSKGKGSAYLFADMAEPAKPKLIKPRKTPGRVKPNRTVPGPEKVRISRQGHAILERLRQGDATNFEMAGIALKYTGRISELRQAGHEIIIVRKDNKTGLRVYRLITEKTDGSVGGVD